MILFRKTPKLQSAATILAIALGSSSPVMPRAWTQTASPYAIEDRTIPPPSMSISAGGSEEAAANLLQAYLQAAGAIQWQGFQATGSIVYAGNEALAHGSATLAVSREGFTRLDVTRSSGSTSLRIRGGMGAFQDTFGKQHRLQASSARAGLLSYPLLLSTELGEQQSLLLAASAVKLGGAPFNKLSLLRPAVEGRPLSPAKGNVVPTDIYFSPDTHLPYKSSDLVTSLDGSPQRYLRVITYEDYRQVEGITIPFRYTETINGQLAWTLKLQEAHSGAPNDPNYFIF
jgi:hypothetical protein